MTTDLIQHIRRVRIAADDLMVAGRHLVGDEAIDSMRALADEVERLRAEVAWQPIETAPKDRWFIGLVEGANAATLTWGVADREWVDDYGDHHDPTHWVPLPPMSRSEQ